MPKKLEAILLQNYSPAAFLIKTTHVHFEIEANHVLVKTRLNIQKVNEESQHLVLTGKSIVLKALYLDMHLLTQNEYTIQNENELVIYNVPTEFMFDIINILEPEKNHELYGLYKTKNILCTQCEPEGFSRITYYLDRPDVLAIFTVSVISDKNIYPLVLSNGNKIETVSVSENKVLTVWHDPYPKPSYLFALVVGNLTVINDYYITQTKRKIQIEFCIEDAYKDKCWDAIKALKQAMYFDEITYKREYDLEQYIVVAVSDFNYGAMENKGLNIFNISCIVEDPTISTDKEHLIISRTVAHEYFHNWTGNRITCRDWFQLSLKEGLTVFREQQFINQIYHNISLRINDIIILKTQQFCEDQSMLSHPVQPQSYIEIDNFYTRTIYQKGAEIIRILFYLLGAENFYKGMSYYFVAYDGMAVTIDDFVYSFEQANHLDLSQFKKWYVQHGTPTVEIKTNYDEHNHKLFLNITQHPSIYDDSNVYPLLIPIEIGLLDQEGAPILAKYNPKKEKNNIFTLLLKDIQQQYEISDVDKKPAISLARNLSAPVFVKMDYATSDLKTIALFEEDHYARWDASYRMHCKEIFSVAHSNQIGKPCVIDSEYIQFIEDLLEKTHKEQDFAILGYMLKLPNIQLIIAGLDNIDNFDYLCNAIQYVAKNHAGLYQNLCKDIYLRINHYVGVDSQAMASRILKNALLQYLTANKTDDEIIYCYSLLQKSTNMTDRFQLMMYICDFDHPLKYTVLDGFYDKWQDNEIMLIKWYWLQANAKGENVLEVIKRLAEHKSFSLANPNKVRALFGTFANENLFYFHNIDGSGYEFIKDQIIKLDQINPYTATSLMNAFINWDKFDPIRQKLMCTIINDILKINSISNKLYEIAAKLIAVPNLNRIKRL